MSSTSRFPEYSLATRLSRLACMLAASLLAACGGGGSSSSAPTVTAPVASPSPAPVVPPATPSPGAWAPPASQLPVTGNYVYTESDAFDDFNSDYIGRGRNYLYTERNALLSVTVSGSTIRVKVEGDEKWSGDFLVPATPEGLKTGLFFEVQGETSVTG